MSNENSSQTTEFFILSIENEPFEAFELTSQNNGHPQGVTHERVEARIGSATEPIFARLDQRCALLNNRNNIPATSNSENTGNG